MEEEVNEEEMEERLYAMLHHLDQSVTTAAPLPAPSGPPAAALRPAMPRYWRAPPLPALPAPRLVRTTVRILSGEPPDPPPVCLDSSSDDDVVEVALSPKSTITVDSSDEEALLPLALPPPAPRPDSPAPSVQSSVSDEFIRSDCIALNISSRRADDHRFDFSLHGTDLVPQSPAQPHKRKGTPLEGEQASGEPQPLFATPRSKNRRRVEGPYESDSNMSSAESGTYAVTAVSLPHADVYESDSNHSGVVTSTDPDHGGDIVMNVTRGAEEGDGAGGGGGGAGTEPALEPGGELLTREAAQRHMHRYYDLSWGGDTFCHRRLQAEMSRDRALWVIDSRDRASTPLKHKPTCGHCGRGGHREAHCRQRPVTCHMCGRPGHRHTHCTDKLCFNCGSAARVWARRCGRCAGWAAAVCDTCSERGHPAPHCPDLWALRDSQLTALVDLVHPAHRPLQDYRVSGSGDPPTRPAAPAAPAVPSDTTADRPSAGAAQDMPRNRTMMLRLLNERLAEMDQEVMEPRALHRQLLHQQRTHRRLLNQKEISSVKLGHSRRRIEIAARRLNAALARDGAAGGAELQRLRAAVGRVRALRRSQVPDPLRRELGHLYRAVFSGAPRDDYSALLQPRPAPHPLMSVSAPSPQIPAAPAAPPGDPASALLQCHRRVMAARPKDGVLKKTRNELMRKLYSQMSLVRNRRQLSAKVMKKTRKIQEQAFLFLNNV